MRNPPWSYEETLLAFELYCRTPFGQITEYNKEIIQLSELLSKNVYRSPSAVSMKMGNLAYWDSEEQARGVKGLAHGSKLDSKIWEDYVEQGFDLINKALYIKSKLLGVDIEKDIPKDLPIGFDIERWVKMRNGQTFFREAVLASYNFQCCITGINIPAFLTASHIKPWRDSTFMEKTNPRNGLCLNALHDKAFDQGYITINDKYEIVVSQKLKEIKNLDDVTKRFIVAKEGQKIIVPRKFKPTKELIEYHNDKIFLG